MYFVNCFSLIISDIIIVAKLYKQGLNLFVQLFFFYFYDNVSHFRIFVDVALLLTYYAGNAVYVVFICQSIHDVSHKLFQFWIYNNLFTACELPFRICLWLANSVLHAYASDTFSIMLPSPPIKTFGTFFNHCKYNNGYSFPHHSLLHVFRNHRSQNRRTETIQGCFSNSAFLQYCFICNGGYWYNATNWKLND